MCICIDSKAPLFTLNSASNDPNGAAFHSVWRIQTTQQQLVVAG